MVPSDPARPAIRDTISPRVAHANMGTALMWAPIFHLLFGNVIIGLGEGLALGFLFRVGKWKATESPV